MLGDPPASEPDCGVPISAMSAYVRAQYAADGTALEASGRLAMAVSPGAGS